MRLIVTTVVRESIRGKQRTGYIYDVDWDARTVVRKLAVPEPQFPETEDNPRGGVRGGRGVAVTRHGIVVANYDTLLRYDDDWRLADAISHPLFVGIHEIDWDGTHVWAAATAIDAVLRIDLESGDAVATWDPHAAEFASRFKLRRRPHPIDGSVDYRKREAPLLDQCHVNGVTRRDGATVVNCGLIRPAKHPLAKLRSRTTARARAAVGMEPPPRRNSGSSVVVRLNGSPTADVLVRLAGHDFPTHNGQLLDDGSVALNDSTGNTLRIFDGHGGPRGSLPIPGRWLRGLEPVGDGLLFVGSAPAGVSLVDLNALAIRDTLQLSDDPNEAVHGLALCPPPAERL